MAQSKQSKLESKQTKLGIDVKKYENYSEWYSQVSNLYFTDNIRVHTLGV